MRPQPPRLEDTPLTWVILIAYVTLLVLCARHDDASSFMDPSAAAMAAFGASHGLLLVDEPWRLVSHAFLHHGLIHLLFNTMFLRWFGPQLERELGSLKFAIVYVVAAIGGGVVGTLWHPYGLLAGGSGALFGMMGAGIALLARSGRSHVEFLEHHVARNLLSMIATNLVLSMFIPMVSNAAHIGGLIAGFAVTYWFLAKPLTVPDVWYRATQAAWVAVFVAVIGYCARPVVRLDWHLRQLASSATPLEQKQQHADALGLELDEAEAIAQSQAQALPSIFGEPGRRLAAHWTGD